MTSARSLKLMESQEMDECSSQEAFIQQCMLPLPSPFFSSPDFVCQFRRLCDSMCRPSLLCSSLGDILALESRVLRLQSPAYVFGDLHGSMDDLRLFSSTLWPLGIHLTPGIFLFLGNYVDYGAFSLELLSYLFVQKACYPEKVFLLRGSHEVKFVNVTLCCLADG